MNRRMTFMLAVMVVLLALVAVYCFGLLDEQRAAAAQAYEGLERSRQLAEIIKEHRQRPALAAEQERLSSEINRLIEEAARRADIPAGNLSLITPMPAIRIGDTAYKEKPTQVSLRAVTLKQVVMLMHQLVSGDSGLHARSVDFRTPRGNEGGDQWEVELVLTYLIYEPLQNAAPGVRR